jgi:hypothetical protein
MRRPMMDDVQVKNIFKEAIMKVMQEHKSVYFDLSENHELTPECLLKLLSDAVCETKKRKPN